MGLESATYVDDLVPSNPTSTDLTAQGDDHIRLIKTALKNTFPNATKPIRIPEWTEVAVDTAIPSSADRFTYRIDTSGGAKTITLPALTGDDFGWECTLIKATYDTNPFFIQAASGNVRTGYIDIPKTRRSIPFVKTRVYWDGGTWWIDRCISIPICSLIPYAGGSDPPPGYEFANGQTLSTSNYPDYAAVRGSGTTPDLRGRVVAGKDDMGGVSADRITSGGAGFSGDGFENTGGAEAIQLTEDQIASHTHSGTTDGQSADHTHSYNVTGSSTAGAGNGVPVSGSGPRVTGGTSNDHTHTFTTGSVGNDEAHNNVQPTIIETYIIVVE